MFYCCMVRVSARGRADTSPRCTRSGAPLDSGQARPTRVRTQGPSPSPAAAEPLGFRVAHCQSARPEGRLTRRSSEVVKPRPKSCPDLGGDLPTCWRSLRAHLASLAHLAHRGRPERRPLLGSCAGNPSPGPKGGAAGIRTPDLRRARAALSQLSYGPRYVVTPGWARLDSNQGPRPYQGRALTS